MEALLFCTYETYYTYYTYYTYVHTTVTMLTTSLSSLEPMRSSELRTWVGLGLGLGPGSGLRLGLGFERVEHLPVRTRELGHLHVLVHEVGRELGRGLVTVG